MLRILGKVFGYLGEVTVEITVELVIPAVLAAGLIEVVDVLSHAAHAIH
ncbi:MAG: hypothetical protein JOZ72_03020 [Alphaproteobacteria bacterium]|nr:hypothetical protein [Alphaproteobacteria bacterium]